VLASSGSNCLSLKSEGSLIIDYLLGWLPGFHEFSRDVSLEQVGYYLADLQHLCFFSTFASSLDSSVASIGPGIPCESPGADKD